MPDLVRRRVPQGSKDRVINETTRGEDGHGVSGPRGGDDLGADIISVTAISSYPTSRRSTQSEPNNDSLDPLDENAVTARSTLIQPRVAVVLGVPPVWHPLLFLCRLLSIAPAIRWGSPSTLRVLMQLYYLIQGKGSCGGVDGGVPGAMARSLDELTKIHGEVEGCGFESFEARLRLTESFLAVVWCGASAYLSFVFTDCLMSRWLVNYSPHGTLVRLITTGLMNVFLTSRMLYLFGAFEHPRLFLPAWIATSTTLTVMYHVTQRKIKIRKETTISISVFSIASFISMVALLIQLHSNRPEYLETPAWRVALFLWGELQKIMLKLIEYGDITKEL